ncbi:MAG: ATP-binding cassette domain-containing protein [Bacteroidales bacterium]|nr:ATP-binding cassette domain-containing protein [Candidatus Colicola coprequi]
MEVRHIHKSFGKQVVLQDVNFHLHPGEVLGLLGPNGAGKSTLMKIIVGLWSPDSGEIDVPSHIGYLPEQNPLYDEMYVREYLQFMSRMLYMGEASPHPHPEGKGDRSHSSYRPLRCYRKEEDPNEIENLIQRVGLTTEANKRIGSLSKGYRQRVGLAQALLGNPELLILDEPTTGLDPNQLTEIRQLIKGLTMHDARCTMHDAECKMQDRGCTVILSTHILQEVREMCDRVIILDHGQIKAEQVIDNNTNIEQLFLNATRGI